MSRTSTAHALPLPSEPELHPRLEELFQCVLCGCQELSKVNMAAVQCQSCGQPYQLKHRILDTLVAATPSLTRELQGMAREAGLSAEEWRDYKIREVPQLPTLEALQHHTEHDAGHYYKQTMMNFEQALSYLPPLGPGSRVLEIGSEVPFAFLSRFKELGAECHALNIYFPYSDPDPFYAWPVRVLGDMNRLPYRNASFDVVMASATSHHTPTPELLLAEIARVLKPGGKALLLNDPLAGWIKGMGGSLAHHRDPLINENTYTRRRYQEAFTAVGLKPHHLFAAYWADRLQQADIHPDTRFAVLARLLSRLWKVPLLRNLIKRSLLGPIQVVFGFPLNVVLNKEPKA